MATPRFNLRNASLYLNKLKNKYQKQANEEDNPYDNTFIDEQEQLTSNPSIKKQSSINIHQHTDPYFSDPPPDNKQPSHSPSHQPSQTNQSEDKQSLQTQFCDLIVIKYLEETLAIYKGDLQILEHNRQNLEQQIYFIGKKIGKLHQLISQNAAINLEIQTLNHNLTQIITHYHQSKKKLFMKKIAHTKLFQNYQHKIKEFLLFGKITHSEQHNYLKPDCLTASYIDQYSAFLNFKTQQSSQINASLKNPEKFQQQKQTLLKKLFQGKQSTYLTQDKTLKLKSTIKLQQELRESEKNKQQKVVLYDEFTNDEEDFPKKSKDGKGKKMTEAEKNLLLGDLKNFSKSFKIPK